MTKYEKLDYLTRWVESQSTQGGKYTLKLSREVWQSELTYTPNA